MKWTILKRLNILPISVNIFILLIEGKRIQWPPLNHQIIADSVDFNSNVQQSVTDQQLDECDLNETTEPTCDQSNQLATNDEDVNEDTQINSSDSSELNSSEKVNFMGFETGCVHSSISACQF